MHADEAPRIVGVDAGVHEPGILEECPKPGPVQEGKPELVHLGEVSTAVRGDEELAVGSEDSRRFGDRHRRIGYVIQHVHHHHDVEPTASLSGNDCASAAISVGGDCTPASIPIERSMPTT